MSKDIAGSEPNPTEPALRKQIDELVKSMVSRFLAWELPKDFSPDAGISYKPYENVLNGQWPGPVGTNLFSAIQAEAMIRHLIGDQLEALIAHREQEAVERYKADLQRAEDAQDDSGNQVDTSVERDFEKDLADMLGGLMRESDEVCIEVWCALANVDWYHPETQTMASESFRSAGGLVAEISGKGDYMTWYCSGQEGVVTNLVARRMKKLGWIYDDMPSICDEPDCFEYAGCGWSDNGHYRHTCVKHMGIHNPRRLTEVNDLELKDPEAEDGTR